MPRRPGRYGERGSSPSAPSLPHPAAAANRRRAPGISAGPLSEISADRAKTAGPARAGVARTAAAGERGRRGAAGRRAEDVEMTSVAGSSRCSRRSRPCVEGVWNRVNGIDRPAPHRRRAPPRRARTCRGSSEGRERAREPCRQAVEGAGVELDPVAFLWTWARSRRIVPSTTVRRAEALATSARSARGSEHHADRRRSGANRASSGVPLFACTAVTPTSPPSMCARPTASRVASDAARDGVLEQALAKPDPRLAAHHLDQSTGSPPRRACQQRVEQLALGSDRARGRDPSKASATSASISGGGRTGTVERSATSAATSPRSAWVW